MTDAQIAAARIGIECVGTAGLMFDYVIAEDIIQQAMKAVVAKERERTNALLMEQGAILKAKDCEIAALKKALTKASLQLK